MFLPQSCEEIITREMERLLFDCVEEVGGKRMKFPTRPSSKWDFLSKWFYTSFSELSDAFEKVQQLNSSQINKNYKKNMKVAEIVYFL